MKPWWLLFFFLLLSPSLHAALPVGDLLNEAFLKESGERKPIEAIGLYQAVVNTPGANSLVLFEARLRMGRCYEQVGNYMEAEKVYEEILKDITAPQSELGRDVQNDVNRIKARKSG